MTGRLAVPADVTEALAAALEIRDVSRSSVTPLSGGCIHPAARIDVEPGTTVFAKWSDRPGPSGFGVEARGLEALGARDAVRVPAVLGFGAGSSDERGWLALEFVEPGPPTSATAAAMGAGLAQLHEPMPDAEPGWSEEGYIGPLPQTNRAHGCAWGGFWVDARLDPQWQSVQERFPAAARDAWDRVRDRVPFALTAAAPSGLSLLHGDLWSGNVLTDTSGEPVLIDPAVYVGDREVDLAMMELFGGFESAVFDRYSQNRPIDPGYAELRRDVYQLYPLLVHVRLFGASYVSGVTTRLERILSAVG